MISAAGTIDAFLFECRRLTRFPRIAWWAALAAFPPVIIRVITSFEGPPLNPGEYFQFATVSFILAAGCATGLALLLVATPVVYSELEGHTWTYLAVRPRGKGSVLVGKYLAAVAWATSAGWLGLFACYTMVGATELSGLWLSMLGMNLLVSLAIGSVLVLLGVSALRKAMVFGVLYILVFELSISNIPAVVSKLTVSYYIRALFFRAADLEVKPPMDELVGTGAPSVYVATLIVYSVVFLGLALYVLHGRQLVTEQDD